MSFIPKVPAGGGAIVAPYAAPCQCPACGLPGYPFTFSYGQTGKLNLTLCARHRDIVAAAVWANDQLGLWGDSAGGCAHAEKIPVGQLGNTQMLMCTMCRQLFLR